MAVAILYATGSGALHAITGPEHLLSLDPVALKERVAAWRVGLVWGMGHAVGTSLLTLPLLVLSRSFHVPPIAALGDRLAGLVLI
jgi:nickel/cobalt exporter